jgi:hypothetical protein
MAERDDETTGRLRLAEQGNTDAKLVVPEDSKDKDELQDHAPADADASGGGGPEGGEAA